MMGCLSGDFPQWLKEASWEGQASGTQNEDVVYPLATLGLHGCYSTCLSGAPWHEFSGDKEAPFLPPTSTHKVPAPIYKEPCCGISGEKETQTGFLLPSLPGGLSSTQALRNKDYWNGSLATKKHTQVLSTQLTLSPIFPIQGLWPGHKSQEKWCSGSWWREWLYYLPHVLLHSRSISGRSLVAGSLPGASTQREWCKSSVHTLRIGVEGLVTQENGNQGDWGSECDFSAVGL